MHGEKLTNGNVTVISSAGGGSPMTPTPLTALAALAPTNNNLATAATYVASTNALSNNGASNVATAQQMVSATTGNILNVKDSRWLQLEVCREFQRGQCSRSDLECKFAHPPPHVEIQNGRVTACYDSIKGRCTRENPKCKYLHPPQHLKDQLLINGRNNLVLKNLLANQMTAQIATPLSISPLTAMPGTSAFIPNIAAATYNPYATYALNAAALYPGFISTSDPYGVISGFMPTPNSMASIAAIQKMVSTTANNSARLERFEADAANANAVAILAAAQQQFQQQQQQQAAIIGQYLTGGSLTAAPGGLMGKKRPYAEPADQLIFTQPQQQQDQSWLMAAAALNNSPVNKRAAVDKGGMPMMQPIYQTMPTLGALPYQQFTVPGLTASYMVPANSLTGNPTALARF